ncbi:MAG TPA: DNA-processing protein DprA [Longimicrobiales bacterium]|nr:DNA-processing protein DprA [Longimicrobiales bacterium]
MSPRHCPHDRRELAARLALLTVPGLKAEQAISLVEATGSARLAFDALGDVFGGDMAAAARTERVRQRTRRALQAVEEQGLHVVTFDDELYPARLSGYLTDYRPPVLFGRGDLSLVQPQCIAIVGSRSASEYGLDVAEDAARHVAHAGGCVVSGVALGVDAAAHRAALEADGATIGVLGCGVDVFYPRRNMELQERIGRCGLLLSEQLPGEPPRKHQFPYRNRIIAALSSAVLIVEAGAKSGALSTAGHAADLGVDVFVVPHAIDRPNAAGNLRLFREGAPVYTGARDMLEQVGLMGVGDPVPAASGDMEYPPPGPEAARIWDSLDARGRHVDSIAAAVGMPVDEVLVALLDLELDGYAIQLGGGRFTRRRRERRILKQKEAADGNSAAAAG